MRAVVLLAGVLGVWVTHRAYVAGEDMTWYVACWSVYVLSVLGAERRRARR